MAASKDSAAVLKALFAKLGHSLEEIRLRALDSILSKLEHQLVCDADLVQEKHLLIRLLEWFNFPSCPKQAQVLGLLLRLAQHTSAAEILLDIGAVEFLTQLRPNLESKLQPQVDSILDCLFRLPAPDAPQHTQECIYRQQGHTVDQSSLPGQLLEPTDSLLETIQSESQGSLSVQHKLSPPEPQFGYFSQGSGDHSGQSVSQDQYTSQPTTSAAICLRFSTFPWVALTATDRHVLSSTDSSLRSRDVSLVTSACEFLSDVVMQDFPPEVFLQRPHIVKSLLSLLAVPAADGSSVSQAAVLTLVELARCIKTRIFYHQDPSVYTPKHAYGGQSSHSVSSSSLSSRTLGSSDTRPSVIGHSDMRHRGDGQDGDNGSNDSRNSVAFDLADGASEETDVEDTLQLQFLQWTIPQFCSAVLEKAVPLLRSLQPALVLPTLQLLRHLLGLLHESLLVPQLWQDNSVPAQELVEKLEDCMEQLAEVLQWHHHSSFSRATPAADLTQHHLVLVGMATWLTDFIQYLVPVELASGVLPDSLVAAVGLLCQDEVLGRSHPTLRASLLPYLLETDSASYNALQRAFQAVHSLCSTCRFLDLWQDKCEDNLVELTELANEAFCTLHRHRHPLYVESCINMASYIESKSCPNPTAGSRARQLVLQLLAHPLQQIRLKAHTACLRLVKDSLSVESVVGVTCRAGQGMYFLLHQQLLYQLVSFGMTDDNPRVCEVAEEILLYLLQSQLLLKTARWHQLLEALTPVLPVLQGFAGLHSALGKCIVGLLDTGSQVMPQTSLPVLERLRGTLRLLYSKEARVRSEGLGRLVWFITNEEGSHEKRPVFDELDVTNLAGLFVVDTQRHLADEDLGRSVFNEEGLRKVYDIFTAGSLEAGVRKSAADQLAIMLSDPGLHKCFVGLHGLEEVLKVLQAGVTRSTGQQAQEVTSLLPSLLAVLRKLLQHSSKLRHRLAHSKDIYYTLLRCGLLLHTEESSKSEVAHALALLLFDEVATVTHGNSAEDSKDSMCTSYSLPALVVDRYHLPFKLSVHHKASVHTTQLPPDDDPLNSGPLADMLRISWNIAWHDGIENLLQAAGQQDAEYSPELQLTDPDRTLLSCSYLPHALQQCVHDVSNATSHQMVSVAIMRLSMYLVTSSGYGITEALRAVKWQQVISRFFQVIPSSSADEVLLAEILAFVRLLMHYSPNASPDLLVWLGGFITSHQGALCGLMQQGDAQTDSSSETSLVAKRNLNRQLLKFIETFVGKIPYTLCASVLSEFVKADLSQGVLRRLNLADAAHFYNLASLESTLQCLMHITARPGWSQGGQTDCLTICLKMLSSLLQVVSAFHIGRGGASTSYMGKGVTRCATICLRHLAHEMASQLHSQDWPRNWLFSRQATADSVGESGLHWLIPLWAYRDTEVRAAGLGIAVALTTTEAGRITMTTQCQHIPGGMWGAAFSILLDQTECSTVREQAALLLINLTSQPMPSGSVETTPNVWQGPVVRNEETQVSLVGLSALLALLHHSRFYQQMAVLLSHFHPQPAIHPISMAGGGGDATGHSSQSTLTTMVSASMQTAPSLSQHQQTSTPAYTERRPSLVGNGTSAEVGTLVTPGADSDPGAQSNNRPVSVDSRGRRGHASGQEDTQTVPPPAGLLATPQTLQGVSTLHDSSSSTTVSAPSVPDSPSVATPSLTAAVCRLLYNLVCLAPEDTLMALQADDLLPTLCSLVDVSLLEAYMKEMESSLYAKQYLVTYRDLLGLYGCILRLLQVCVAQDTVTRGHLLDDTATLTQMVRLLKVNCLADADTQAACCHLWESVFTTLLVVLQSEQGCIQQLTPVLVRHWHTLTDCVVQVLSIPDGTQDSLKVVTQQCLALLLAEEGRWPEADREKTRRISQVLDTLGKSAEPVEGDVFACCSGARLCGVLVKAYDAVALRPYEQAEVPKLATINALKALLAVSSAAKLSALEAGLVESITEQLKDLTVRLNLEALDVSTPTPHKRKDHPLLAELVHTLELLRNLLYQNIEVKAAACECGLATIVHRLWAWGQMEPNLMAAILALLATFTANCPQACSSLAFTSIQAVQEKPGRCQLSSNSLVHALLRLLQKGSLQAQPLLLSSAFSLLATLALSQECRGIIWKSNFVQEFSRFAQRKKKRSRLVALQETLWLDLLLNLSFSTEGHNMLLNIPDCIDLLMEFGLSSSLHHQRASVLIIRNLCCHAANKPKLLANDKLVAFLLDSLNGCPEVQVLASSAIWALLHNNQKAKVVLKNASFVRQLRDAYNAMLSRPPDGATERTAQQLHDILATLRE